MALKAITMTNQEILSALSAILKKSKHFGAHLAGIANVDDLKMAPSFERCRSHGRVGLYWEEQFGGDA